MTEYAVSPSGERFPLPTPEDDAAEMRRLEALAAEARRNGMEVVVVMGLGFVGAVMAAIVSSVYPRRCAELGRNWMRPVAPPFGTRRDRRPRKEGDRPPDPPRGGAGHRIGPRPGTRRGKTPCRVFR